MKRTVLIIGIVSLAIFSLKAQETTFSQFYLNKMYINPAYTGVYDALDLSLTHRNQWLGIGEGNLFNATRLSLDYGVSPRNNSNYGSGMGIGFTYVNSKAGDSFFRTDKASFSLSSDAPRIVTSRFSAQFPVGISIGYVTQKLDWTSLVFSDQLDPVLGNVMPTAAPPTSLVDNTSSNYLDLGFGGIAAFKFGNSKTQNFLSVGYSVHKYVRMNAITSEDYSMPTKHTVHGLFHAPLGDQMVIAPGFIYEQQKNLATATIGSQIYLNKDFLGGIWLRNRDFRLKGSNFTDLIVNLVYSFDRVMIGYSYDLTISSLGIGNTFGTHEVTLHVRLYNSNQRFINQRRSNSRCFFEGYQ